MISVNCSLEEVAKLSATIELEADRVRLWNKKTQVR